MVVFSGEIFHIECVLLVLKHYAPSGDTVDRREIPWMEQIVCKECSRANLGANHLLYRNSSPGKTSPENITRFLSQKSVLLGISTVVTPSTQLNSLFFSTSFFLIKLTKLLPPTGVQLKKKHVIP